MMINKNLKYILSILLLFSNQSIFCLGLESLFLVGLLAVKSAKIIVMNKHFKQQQEAQINQPKNYIISQVTASDYAGKLPKEIASLIQQLQNPISLYADLDLSFPNGILLVGPPGTGKTLLASVIAGELKCPFFNCSSGDFILFNDALFAASTHNTKTAIIFIDEIESLIPNKNRNLHYESHQTLNTLLHHMDGTYQKVKSPDAPRIILIGATNNIQNIDPAFLRPGRFTHIINIKKPSYQTRKELFQLYIQKIKHTHLDINAIDFDQLAYQTQSMTGDQINNITQTAKKIYMDKLNSYDDQEKITTNDFIEAIKNEKQKYASNF